MFFNQAPLVHLSQERNQELEAGYKCIILWLVITISGMIIATLWQWVSGIHATSLMDSPFILRVMMIGGFIAFIVSLINTLFVLPIWHDISKYAWPKLKKYFF